MLSPLLFNRVLDIVMRKSTSHKRGIRWDLQDEFEDLDYADNICLLSRSFSNMQSKLNLIRETAVIAGLKINICKPNILRLNANAERKFLIYAKEIDDVESSCELGSIIDKSGGSLADVASCINKARNAFAQFNHVRKSKISRRTQIKIFNCNVKSTLLYGCKT